MGPSFLLARIARGEEFIDKENQARDWVLIHGPALPDAYSHAVGLRTQSASPALNGTNWFWGSQFPPDHPKVSQFIESMQRCAFALCPHEWSWDGHVRLRGVLFRQSPIVIRDNFLVGEPEFSPEKFVTRLPSTATDDKIGRA
jgi:hypothetical protein